MKSVTDDFINEIRYLLSKWLRICRHEEKRQSKNYLDGIIGGMGLTKMIEEIKKTDEGRKMEKFK